MDLFQNSKVTTLCFKSLDFYEAVMFTDFILLYNDGKVT
jgi:hypothetical protein